MRFKHGDKVRLKKGLTAGNNYESVTYVKSMDDYSVLTIDMVDINYDTYTVRENAFLYSESMLEPYCESHSTNKRSINVDVDVAVRVDRTSAVIALKMVEAYVNSHYCSGIEKSKRNDGTIAYKLCVAEGEDE